MSLNSSVYAVYIPKDLIKTPQLIIYEGRQTVLGFSVNTVGGVYVADQQTTHRLTDADFEIPFTLPKGGQVTYFKDANQARARLDLEALQRIQCLEEEAQKYQKAWLEQMKEFEFRTGIKLADRAKEVSEPAQLVGGATGPRLTDSRVAEKLRTNIEGLERAGIDPSMSDKRYVKLAWFEDQEENGKLYW